MLRYAITDRHLFPAPESARQDAVVHQACRLAAEGVEYLQVREKDLPAQELLRLTLAVQSAISAAGWKTRVILNGPPALASAAGLALHLPFSMWWSMKDASGVLNVTSISCHTPEEVEAAFDFAEVLLFAPVFQKQIHGEQVLPGRGLAALAEACRRAGSTPVLALGGVTHENAQACMAAGARGIAGIRMFLD